METTDEVEIESVCSICASESDVVESQEGEMVCDQCTLICERCESIYSSNDSMYSVEGEMWCDPCTMSYAYYCDEHDGYFTGYTYTANDSNRTFCEVCFQDNVSYCDECDEYYYDGCNIDHDGEMDGRLIHDYSYRPDPIFYRLPDGTVSASNQVDITATTNYSTFSSSLATVDAGQTTRIDNLASLTSSYAINATIQGQLAGVVSSSTQVKPLLPGGTVSASNQVDITATTGYSTFSSSLATVDAGQTTRIDNLASLTSSYAINATIQGQLAGVVSSSTQVKPLLPGGTVSASGQVDITESTYPSIPINKPGTFAPIQSSWDPMK